MTVSRISSEGSRAIVGRGLIEYIPVASKPGTLVMAGNEIMFEFKHTVRDADVKVLLCAVKAYTDNHFDAIQSAKGLDPKEYAATEVASIHLDVAQLSRLAYNERAKGVRLTESIDRWKGVNIHLMHNGESRGSVSICSGAVLSKDRKTIELGLNKRLIVDMANKMLVYNFDEMLSHKGIAHRAFMGMQMHKHRIGKNKSGYHRVEDKKWRKQLSLNNDPNAKHKIEKAFKDIGIDFKLHPNGFWDWSNKKTRV